MPSFFRGQQLGREDLKVFTTNSSNTPTNAAEISYDLYDVTTGAEVLIPPQARHPANPSIGEYYVSIVVPLDARLGLYRVRWHFRELVGGMIGEAVQEFDVIDKVTVGSGGAPTHHGSETFEELTCRLRTMLRDNNPDRNYHFRPPTQEETISQFSRVFGFIWEDQELREFIEFAFNSIIAYPPRTPFASVDQMIAMKREWTTLLLTGARVYALQALQTNWIADEFEYSIGGVSLNLDKASKYGAQADASEQMFDKQLEKAKATVNFVRGLQQPKYGTGIRSAFGPFVGRGVLSPRKFTGF